MTSVTNMISPWSLLQLSIDEDLTSYLDEFGLAQSSPSTNCQREVLDTINKYDCVIYIKSGCRYCEKAISSLELIQVELGFTLCHLSGTDSCTRSALSSVLGRQGITFPVIIVKNIYIGGWDDYYRSEHEFRSMLTRPRRTRNVDWQPDLLHDYLYPKYLLNLPWIDVTQVWHCTTTGDNDDTIVGRWYCFQWYIYSNMVRYISAIHVAWLTISLVLLSFPHTHIVGLIFTYLFTIDLAGLVVHGIAPFSFSGVLALSMGWRVKGSLTCSIPYKVVWLIYLCSIFPLLARATLLNQSNTISAAGMAMLATFILNSLLLSVSRF